VLIKSVAIGVARGVHNPSDSRGFKKEIPVQAFLRQENYTLAASLTCSNGVVMQLTNLLVSLVVAFSLSGWAQETSGAKKEACGEFCRTFRTVLEAGKERFESVSGGTAGEFRRPATLKLPGAETCDVEAGGAMYVCSFAWETKPKAQERYRGLLAQVELSVPRNWRKEDERLVGSQESVYFVNPESETVEVQVYWAKNDERVDMIAGRPQQPERFRAGIIIRATKTFEWIPAKGHL
jgi:hypothetical protein